MALFVKCEHFVIVVAVKFCDYTSHTSTNYNFSFSFYFQLYTLRTQAGQAQYERLLQMVDNDTLSQINEYYFSL